MSEIENIEEKIKPVEQKVDSWFKTELKTHWGKIIMCILATAIVITAYVDLRDDVKHFFTKDNKTIVQVSPTPVNINANGEKITQLPPTYVNVNPIVTEHSIATLTQDPKATHPSVAVSDPAPVFTLDYNGKKFDYIPHTSEQMNFDANKWTFDYTRKTEMDVNVEVPTPKYSMGIGITKDKNPALMGAYRLGTTPFNVWGYASSKDQAIGLNFTQYATPDKKGVK